MASSSVANCNESPLLRGIGLTAIKRKKLGELILFVYFFGDYKHEMIQNQNILN
jgi:hypothetical protein